LRAALVPAEHAYAELVKNAVTLLVYAPHDDRFFAFARDQVNDLRVKVRAAIRVLNGLNEFCPSGDRPQEITGPFRVGATAGCQRHPSVAITILPQADSLPPAFGDSDAKQRAHADNEDEHDRAGK